MNDMKCLVVFVDHFSIFVLLKQEFKFNTDVRAQSFNCIGQIAARQPALFNKSMEMLETFFRALKEERDSVLLQNVHEGLSLLRGAYKQAELAVLLSVQNFLLAQLNEEKRVLLIVLQYFNHLFPFHHLVSRYSCLLLSSNPAVLDLELGLELDLDVTFNYLYLT